MQEIDILERSKYILLAYLLVFFSCSKLTDADNQKIKEALSDSTFTTSYSKNVDMDILEDGMLKVNLKGAAAKTYTVDGNEFTALTGPVYISLFEGDTLNSEVFSDSALYSNSHAAFELFGNVKVITKQGRRLNSSYLNWERNSDRISTNKDVIIVTQTDSINAKGLVGNSDLTNYTLNEVTGQTVIN